MKNNREDTQCKKIILKKIMKNGRKKEERGLGEGRGKERLDIKKMRTQAITLIAKDKD